VGQGENRISGRTKVKQVGQRVAEDIGEGRPGVAGHAQKSAQRWEGGKMLIKAGSKT